MMKWIDMLNAMYAEHPYTDGGRVVVEFCPELGVMVVKVLNKYKVVELHDLNEWGVLTATQDAVRELYESI
jgi:hypothetical protein